MAHGIRFNLNESLFVRDPQDTDYGRNLLDNSVLLMDEIGFDAFTFKKLATRISSTEASVYRYFENKHKLLLFLTNWYWDWVSYLIDINTKNLLDPSDRLRVALHNIVYASVESHLTAYINEEKLHHIVINEGAKAYHTHLVDDENKEGLFQSYKVLVDKLADMILAVNSDFPYAHSVASNIYEHANNQIYFSEHLPRLTDIKNKKNKRAALEKMLNFLMEKLLA